MVHRLWLLAVGLCLLLLTGCERDGFPPLVEVRELGPQQVEVGDRVLAPGLELLAGEVNRRTGKGRHTTTAAVLLGGALVVVGTLLFGWRMFAAGVGSSGTALASMLVGKAMQWITLALGLFLVIGVLHFPVVPVVSGVIAAQVGFWIGTGLIR